MKTNYPTYRYYSLKFNANRTFQMTPKLYVKLMKKYHKYLNDDSSPVINVPMTADKFIEQWLTFHL